MDTAERRAAKARLVEGMLRGEAWEDAVIASGLTLGRKGFNIDRDGMAAEFLAQLAGAGRHVVTLLRRDQYDDLSSFDAVGPFTPWRRDRRGTPLQEVAPARYRPRRPHDERDLGVANLEVEGGHAGRLDLDHDIVVPRHKGGGLTHCDLFLLAIRLDGRCTHRLWVARVHRLASLSAQGSRNVRTSLTNAS